MAMTKAKAGKKGRKHGRNKAYCEVYRSRGTRERNKARRFARTLKAQPNNKELLKVRDEFLKDNPGLSKLAGE